MGSQRLPQSLRCVLATLVVCVAVVAPQPGFANGEADDGFDRLGAEEPTPVAGVELAAGQAVHGAVLGIQGCMAAGCDSALPFVLSPAIGAAAGAGGGFLWTRHRDVTPGRATSVNSAAMWSGLVALTFSSVSGIDHRSAMATMMATQLVGTTAGWMLADWLQPTAGDVALMNTAGIWSGVIYLLMTSGVLQLNLSPAVGMTGLAAAAATGITAGGFAARTWPMSRGRAALISASGLVGSTLGAVTPRLIAGDAATTPASSAVTTGGAVLGLGLSAFLTRNLNARDEDNGPTTSFSVTPATDGTGAVGSVVGRF